MKQPSPAGVVSNLSENLEAFYYHNLNSDCDFTVSLKLVGSVSLITI